MITRYRTETDTYEVNDADKTFRSVNTVGVATEWEPYVNSEVWDFDAGARSILSLLLVTGRQVLTPYLTGIEKSIIPLELD